MAYKDTNEDRAVLLSLDGEDLSLISQNTILETSLKELAQKAIFFLRVDTLGWKMCHFNATSQALVIHEWYVLVFVCFANVIHISSIF